MINRFCRDEYKYNTRTLQCVLEKQESKSVWVYALDLYVLATYIIYYNEKQEILSCISDAKLNKNDVQIESSHKNGNSEGETAHFNSNDHEPMEAHETKYTAHADYGEVIYLITIDVYRS